MAVIKEGWRSLDRFPVLRSEGNGLSLFTMTALVDASDLVAPEAFSTLLRR